MAPNMKEQDGNLCVSWCPSKFHPTMMVVSCLDNQARVCRADTSPDSDVRAHSRCDHRHHFNGWLPRSTGTRREAGSGKPARCWWATTASCTT